MRTKERGICMGKKIDVEFYEKGRLNGEKRIEIKRKDSESEIEFRVVNTFNETSEIVILEEKEALELASQLFRNILDLY